MSASNGHATAERPRRRQNGRRAPETPTAHVPPHDTELERLALACAMLDASGNVRSHLRPEWFHAAHHRTIFEHLQRIERPDIGLLLASLRESDHLEDVGGAPALKDVISGVPDFATWQYYLERLRKLWADRERWAAIHDANHSAPSRETAKALQERLIEIEAAEQAASDGATYERLTCADLANGDWRQQYFVRDVLAVGQHGIVAGRFKTLKTGIGVVDLGLSIATGTPFLGHFEVETPGRVGIFSGESGKAALKDWGLRIAAAKGINLANVSSLVWSTQLPQIGEMAHMDALERFIKGDELDLCIIDPSYLAFSSVANDAGNVFSVGKLLAQITDLGNRIGCTMLIVNHNNRSRSRSFDPPDLMDVAWSGFAEWARQWICLGPRREWEPDTGQHWLWMTIGGSAGHAGLYGLDVTEGRRSDPGGRIWQVDVLSADEARQGAASESQDARKAAKAQKKLERHTAAIEAIRDAFRTTLQDGGTVNMIATAAGLSRNSETFCAAIGELVRTGELVECKVKSPNGQEYEGWRRVYEG